MKLKMSQLRRIIKEEVEVAMDEMAYGGKLPTKKFIGNDEDDIGIENSKGVERYVSTPMFAKRATDLLNGLPVDVWIAPIAAGVMDDTVSRLYSGLGEKRVKRIKSEVAEKYLTEFLGYDPEEVADKLRPGSSIIIGLHGNFERNFTPAVWTMLHAFFDNDEAQVKSIFGPVADIVCEALFGCSYSEVDDEGDRVSAWMPYLPFKWAGGDYSAQASSSDVVAECLVAAGFRPSGFKFKRPSNGELDPAMVDEAEATIRSQRDAIRSGFSKFIDGFLVVVNVTEVI